MDIPVISFIGWSGSGKTTFLEKLIPVLRGRGLRVAVLKSDGHEFQMDREGKDTFRFSSAGAECVAIANSRHAAILENRTLSFGELYSRVKNVDLILAEGWYAQPLPRIEVFRGHDRLRCTDPENLWAVITDEQFSPGVPVFGLEDVAPVADFIIEKLSEKDKCFLPYIGLLSGETKSGGRVTLSVDGHEVPLLPFVQEVIRSVNTGIISSLKDSGLTPSSEIRIRISAEDLP